MNVLKEKYNEVKIIFSIVMGFIGITGIQMQYLNYAQNVPGGGYSGDCIFRHLQVVLSNFDKERN